MCHMFADSLVDLHEMAEMRAALPAYDAARAKSRRAAQVRP